MDRSTDGLLAIGLLGLVLLVTSVGPCAEITAREPTDPDAESARMPAAPLILPEAAPPPPPLAVGLIQQGELRPLAAGTLVRSRAAAIDLGDGRMLFAGGEDETGAPSRESWLIRSSGLSVEAQPLAIPRVGAEALRTARGVVVLIGGLEEESASAELWDPAIEGWGPGGRLMARDGFALAALADGGVLAAGGSSAEGEVLRDVQLLDTSLAQWLPTEPMREPRRDAAAVALSDGRVLVLGGLGADGGPRSDTELRAEDGRWTSGPRMSHPRAGHAAVRLADGRALIAGEGTTELFDPATSTFTNAGRLSSIGRVRLVATAEGGALAITRLDGRCSTAAIEQWRPGEAGWQPFGSHACDASTVLGPGGRLFVVGGEPAAK